jgi:hypothetical protein
MTTRLQPPYYPIVYVRGYAMRAEEREETFYDTYYGFAATSVEKRQAAPPRHFEADMFEGQLVRFMKLGEYSYADSVNKGERVPSAHPGRSLWVCRFYDQDYYDENIRNIEDHAEELRVLVCKTIPDRLRESGLDLGNNDEDFRVILLAHSMGGLVCRTLIQTLLPGHNEDPKRWIHRFVTMGTPHGGIELAAVPDFMERLVARTGFNPMDANIFMEPRMRQYLSLPSDCDVHSLGPESDTYSFPVKRCLCLIGSDYHSYSAVRFVTGSFSDGLVKQNNAYLVNGPKPEKGVGYDDAHTAFYANVHRAHSGRRGIVNSYESFENIQRFLFGNIKLRILLKDLQIHTKVEDGSDAFYDFEFLFAIRNSNAFLHRRQQDPCENALRFLRQDVPSTLLLHTAFLNSELTDADDPNYAHFAMRFRVLERKVKHGWLRDTDYPERQIYSEGIEVRLGRADKKNPVRVEYHWLSDANDWERAVPSEEGTYSLPLRGAEAVTATVVVEAERWPNNELTRDALPERVFV